MLIYYKLRVISIVRTFCEEKKNQSSGPMCGREAVSSHDCLLEEQDKSVAVPLYEMLPSCWPGIHERAGATGPFVRLQAE